MVQSSVPISEMDGIDTLVSIGSKSSDSVSESRIKGDDADKAVTRGDNTLVMIANSDEVDAVAEVKEVGDEAREEATTVDAGPEGGESIIDRETGLYLLKTEAVRKLTQVSANDMSAAAASLVELSEVGSSVSFVPSVPSAAAKPADTDATPTTLAESTIATTAASLTAASSVALKALVPKTSASTLASVIFVTPAPGNQDTQVTRVVVQSEDTVSSDAVPNKRSAAAATCVANADAAISATSFAVVTPAYQATYLTPAILTSALAADPAALTSTTDQAANNWVQCENPNCLKWRKLPWHVDVNELPEKFYCKDNVWSGHHESKAPSCDDPQEPWDVESAFIGSDYESHGYFKSVNDENACPNVMPSVRFGNDASTSTPIRRTTRVASPKRSKNSGSSTPTISTPKSAKKRTARTPKSKRGKRSTTPLKAKTSRTNSPKDTSVWNNAQFVTPTPMRLGRRKAETPLSEVTLGGEVKLKPQKTPPPQLPDLKRTEKTVRKLNQLSLKPKIRKPDGRGSRARLFPEVVHDMVTYATEHYPDVIRWNEDGDAFYVWKTDEELHPLLQMYFRHSKYSSFQRQLNMYGWKKHLSGKYHGAFQHPQFHRNDSSSKVLKRIVRKGAQNYFDDESSEEESDRRVSKFKRTPRKPSRERPSKRAKEEDEYEKLSVSRDCTPQTPATNRTVLKRKAFTSACSTIKKVVSEQENPDHFSDDDDDEVKRDAYSLLQLAKRPSKDFNFGRGKVFVQRNPSSDELIMVVPSIQPSETHSEVDSAGLKQAPELISELKSSPLDRCKLADTSGNSNVAPAPDPNPPAARVSASEPSKFIGTPGKAKCVPPAEATVPMDIFSSPLMSTNAPTSETVVTHPVRSGIPFHTLGNTNSIESHKRTDSSHLNDVPPASPNQRRAFSFCDMFWSPYLKESPHKGENEKEGSLELCPSNQTNHNSVANLTSLAEAVSGLPRIGEPFARLAKSDDGEASPGLQHPPDFNRQTFLPIRDTSLESRSGNKLSILPPNDDVDIRFTFSPIVSKGSTTNLPSASEFNQGVMSKTGSSSTEPKFCTPSKEKQAFNDSANDSSMLAFSWKSSASVTLASIEGLPRIEFDDILGMDGLDDPMMDFVIGSRPNANRGPSMIKTPETKMSRKRDAYTNITGVATPHEVCSSIHAATTPNIKTRSPNATPSTAELFCHEELHSISDASGFTRDDAPRGTEADPAARNLFKIDPELNQDL